MADPTNPGEVGKHNLLLSLHKAVADMGLDQSIDLPARDEMARAVDFSGPVTLRSDDPSLAPLLDDGWLAVGESWGARLALDDAGIAHLRSLVHRATAQGLPPGELDAGWAPELVRLERANRPDYPRTPATLPPELDEASTVELWRSHRVFGIHDGLNLVAVSVIGTTNASHGETEFTSVAATHRRRGLATAVKAASVLALAQQGIRSFGTGGAQANAASLAMNAALGYRVTERWLSLEHLAGD